MPNTALGAHFNSDKGLDNISDSLRRIFNGHINVTGTFSPSAAATTTTVNYRNIGKNSILVLAPLTAEAAAMLPKFYEVSASRTNSSAVFGHPNFSSVTNLTYMLLIIG
jgi:hypothetical protein